MASILLVAAAVFGGERYALSLEPQYIHAIAPEHSPAKDLGSSLQREAFRQSDLLPIYGSSELLDDENPYNGSNLFHDYPTGFTIFPIGDVGTTTLIMVQRLAAIGPDLRDKRVVISLSPYWYFNVNSYSEEYAGSFSRLNAGELAFSTHLSFATKQEAARRMLEYPQTLADDPVLRFALEQLAGGSAWNSVLYYTVFPLGVVQNRVLELQEEWASLTYLNSAEHPTPSPTHEPRHLDWQSIISIAEQEYASHANNNPFGFENRWYERKFDKSVSKNQLTHDSFYVGLDESEEWTDLDVLLRALNEMGAQPLVLCAPPPGAFYDALGVSAQDRSVYYERLRQKVESFGVPVLVFSDHDQDRYFVKDTGAHLSEKGWAYFDYALDTFYRGDLRGSRD